METYKTYLKDWCFTAPHWMQLQIQAFWYGFISYLMECVEHQTTPTLEAIRIEDLLAHAHPEFRKWPTVGLEEHVKRILSISSSYTQDQLDTLYADLDALFQDVIPIDLNIFMVLAEGNELTEEQVQRLYDVVAFIPPATNQTTKSSKLRHHTRRVHGRRGITPIRRRRAKTHHAPRPVIPPVQVVKLG